MIDEYMLVFVQDLVNLNAVSRAESISRHQAHETAVQKSSRACFIVQDLFRMGNNMYNKKLVIGNKRPEFIPG